MFLREILTKIGFKVDGTGVDVAESRVNKFKAAARAAKRETDSLRKNLNFAAKAAKGMIVAMVAGRAIKALTTDYSNGLDVTAKFADSMGMGVESLQALQYAADLSGISSQELNVGIKTLSVNMREAGNGVKTYTDIFRDIGVEYKNANGTLKTQEEMLLAVSERFAASEGGAAKAALAVKLFGKAGAKMVVLLDQGPAGIKKMMEEAKKLGLIMSPEQAKQAQDFNDRINTSKRILSGLRNQLAAELIPSIIRVLERFIAWVKEGDNLQRMLGWVKMAMKGVALILARMALGQVVGIFMALASAVGAAGRALQLMGIMGAAAQAKMGILLGAITLIGLAFWQLWRFANGKGSIFDSILGEEDRAAFLGMFADLKAAMMELWENIKEPMKELGKALAQVFLAFKPAIPPLVKLLGWILKWTAKILTWIIKDFVKGIKTLVATWGEISRAIDDVGRGAVRVWEAVKSAFWSVIDAIKGAWNTVIDSVTKTFNAVVEKAKRAGRAISDFLFGGDVHAVIVKYNETPGAPTPSRGDQIKDQISAQRGPGAAGGTTTSNSVNTGPVNVTVNSAPSMPPEEFQRRIDTGVKDAFKGVIKSTFQNRAVVAQ